MAEIRAIRTQTPELRLSETGNTLYGYAARYNVESRDLGFYEIIEPGAFDRSLEAGDDVVALFNHDASKVLGRRDAGTLKLRSETNVGLAFTLDLPDTPTGAEVRELVSRGDLREMSFAFVVKEDEWRNADGKRTRHLHEVGLRDVSVVTEAAYPQTVLNQRGSDMNKPKELYAELRTLTNQARQILEQEPEPTGEDQQQLDRLFARVDEIEGALTGIANAAKMEAAEAVLEEPTVDASRHRGTLATRDIYGTPEYREAFWNYCRTGDRREIRDMSVGSDGAVVPTDMERTIVKEIDQLTIIRNFAKVMTWDSNRDVPIEDSIGSGGWVAEAAAITEADASFSTKSFSAYKYASAVTASNELLFDAQMGQSMSEYLGAVLGRRFSIGLEAAYTQGDGSGQPSGVWANSGTAGQTHTIASGVTFASVDGDDIIDTAHKLPPQYRSGATWMLTDSMLKAVRQMKTTTDEYIWKPAERYSDLRDGPAGTLYGYPYFVVDDANGPAAGASERAAIFGDFSYFWIADRQGMTLLVDPYTKSLNDQTTFVATRRTDSHVVLPGAFSVLKLAAS